MQDDSFCFLAHTVHPPIANESTPARIFTLILLYRACTSYTSEHFDSKFRDACDTLLC
jgi:hypothetical protein